MAQLDNTLVRAMLLWATITTEEARVGLKGPSTLVPYVVHGGAKETVACTRGNKTPVANAVAEPVSLTPTVR